MIALVLFEASEICRHVATRVPAIVWDSQNAVVFVLPWYPSLYSAAADVMEKVQTSYHWSKHQDTDRRNFSATIVESHRQNNDVCLHGRQTLGQRLWLCHMTPHMSSSVTKGSGKRNKNETNQWTKVIQSLCIRNMAEWQRWDQLLQPWFGTHGGGGGQAVLRTTFHPRRE